MAFVIRRAIASGLRIRLAHEADMGMRADVDAVARDELSRSHLVEDDERPDHRALRRGKRVANLEITDVARSRHDQRVDRLDGDGVGTNGV